MFGKTVHTWKGREEGILGSIGMYGPLVTCTHVRIIYACAHIAITQNIRPKIRPGPIPSFIPNPSPSVLCGPA